MIITPSHTPSQSPAKGENMKLNDTKGIMLRSIVCTRWRMECAMELQSYLTMEYWNCDGEWRVEFVMEAMFYSKMELQLWKGDGMISAERKNAWSWITEVGWKWWFYTTERLSMMVVTIRKWNERDVASSLRMECWSTIGSGKRTTSSSWNNASSTHRKWLNMLMGPLRIFFRIDQCMSEDANSTKQVDLWSETVLVVCWT